MRGRLVARLRPHRRKPRNQNKLSRQFQFQKRSQLLVGVHNKAFSIVPMRIHNPIVRPLQSTAEIQPKLQPASGIIHHLRRRFACFKLCAHLLQAGP